MCEDCPSPALDAVLLPKLSENGVSATHGQPPLPAYHKQLCLYSRSMPTVLATNGHGPALAHLPDLPQETVAVRYSPF